MSDAVCQIDPSFSFQPVLHNWNNRHLGMYYLVCEMVLIKDPLVLTGMNGP